ncbi:S41 family peptidase [Adlercreutzia sp. ZJ154]|uniref:S41 family peptidase n=1 Tax=Adlercreutzia sp. ZJ154 TaxID=2709790 RepID=UPI001F155843|nr:S41 family peptidase [Adlercreutzia sp. ZJ154]
MSTERLSANKRKRKNANMRERMRNRKVVSAFCCFLAIVIAFVLGFVVRSNTAFVQSLGFPTEWGTSQPGTPASEKTTYEAISARVGEVEDILKLYSMDELDLSKATSSMLEDMMRSTNDPYAQYYDPSRYENFVKESAEKSYSGIGVLFGEYDGRAYVTDVFTGSEANARGVEQGDFVVAIDGDSSHKWSMTEVIGSLKRGEGSNVVITWMRPASLDATNGEQFTTTLECRVYEEENISYSIDGDVGYVKVRQMTSDAAALVKNAVNDLSNQQAKAFVIDVRDNPGGYLTQALDMASLFVSGGVLVSIQTNDNESPRNALGETITTAPIVVLMNQYTAASAEVFAAALEDNQRATMVGQTTMGKGSVQVVRELTFGGAVRYTAAYYLTPQGHSIDGTGVTPDIVVANQDGEDGDTQLNVALDAAHSMIEGA